MTGSWRQTALALATAVVAALALAPSASAAITGSTIATPADGSFLLADQSAASSTFAVSGTTTGGNPATDKVDLLCFAGTDHPAVQTNVALALNGSFSVPAADLIPIHGSECRLRAVPAGTVPATVTPFAGPRLEVSNRRNKPVTTGPNAGRLTDFTVTGQQPGASFAYNSLGSCGLADGSLDDGTLAVTTSTFFCNDWLFSEDTQVGPPTRSELRVDGIDSYPTDPAAGINPSASGLPALAYAVALDPATGNLTIHESDPIVKCTDPTYPPNATRCATFVPTGVRNDRTIVQDHGGHLSTIGDVFSSADGHAHSLDLQFRNDERFRPNFTGDSRLVEYRFPGQSAFSQHVLGDVVPLPAAAPASIFLNSAGAPDGDTATGKGAITYDRAPSSARFTLVSTNFGTFVLQDTATIPAGGATRFRFAYAQDYSSANVAALARLSEDRFGLPTVRIAAPANGAIVHTPTVTVTGTATDSVGVASLVVGGHGVVTGAGGIWATTVGLRPGTDTIVASARDAAGNAAQTQVQVTYQPPPAVRCKVPKLKGKTLKAAKKALKKAHCRAGKVSRKRSTKIKRGRVISSNPRAGKKRAAGTKVKLAVSRGRH